MNQSGAKPSFPGKLLAEQLVAETRRAQKIFQNAFRAILKGGVSLEVAEAAFPAYAHRNPVIKWIFWGRLQEAFRLFPAQADTLLDFGCGSGICSYAAANCGMIVTALDLNLAPQDLVSRHVVFPKDIRFIACELSQLVSEGRRFDVILALDVLEHVPAYTETLEMLLGLLEPDGALIISLPTETVFYRIGRKLAGREFTGDYHRAGASEIEKALQQLAIIDHASYHPPLIGLFRVLRARPRMAHAQL